MGHKQGLIAKNWKANNFLDIDVKSLEKEENVEKKTKEEWQKEKK